MAPNQFPLDDIYTAAGVTFLSGIEPDCKTGDDAKVQFVFPMIAEVMDALAQYTSGASGSLSGYARSVRKIRARMWGARNCAK